MIDKIGTGNWVITADDNASDIRGRANSYKFIMRKWDQVRHRLAKEGVVGSYRTPKYTARAQHAVERIRFRENAIRAGDFEAAGITQTQQGNNI